MAFAHGRITVFKLDDTSGTLDDISDFCDTTDLNRTIETGDTTTYGDDNKTYIVGLADATIGIGGKWDESVDGTIAGGSEPASRSFEFGPAGSATGKIKYEGNCIVTNYSISNPVGDVVTWSADMQVTGVIVRGAY